jgi:hypothetical protein
MNWPCHRLHFSACVSLAIPLTQNTVKETSCVGLGGRVCVLYARTLHYKITHLTIKIKGEAFDLFTLGTAAAASLFFPLFSPDIIPFHLHDNARGGFEKFWHC